MPHLLCDFISLITEMRSQLFSNYLEQTNGLRLYTSTQSPDVISNLLYSILDISGHNMPVLISKSLMDDHKRVFTLFTKYY